MSTLTEYFNRRSSTKAVPAPAAKPVVDRIEVAYAHSWNMTYSTWQALTPEQRKDYRDRVAYAPNLRSKDLYQF